MKPVIIGTAGHIDHGKTALVKALTGTNTDRLKEEQDRGITIELGYAFLSDHIAFIDVPGHERFIKNMVAGVSTVDFALLVIAADDGIMPQTLEHFDILRLLDIPDGVIAITKCDLQEDDWLGMVEEEIVEMVRGSFLEGRAIVRVDSLSGRGIDDMKKALFDLAGRKRQQTPGSVFRLPIDRVFTIKGFGTVVTGSALSGQVAVEDRLELLPQGITVRVRGIESQAKHVKSASAGMRVALNVPQIAVDDASRGDILASQKRLRPTFMLDAKCRILKSSPVPLKQRQRIRLHMGTKEVMARVVILDQDEIEPGQEGFVQFRLEEPTAAQRLDRYVIRRYSPQITIGGGTLLDANPAKHRKRHKEEVVTTLKQFSDAKVGQLLTRFLAKEKVLTFDDLVTQSGLSAEQVEETLGILGIEGEIIEIEAKGTRHLCSKSVFSEFEEKLVQTLTKYHKSNPLRGGAKRSEVLTRFKKELPGFLLKHFVDLSLAGLTIKTKGSDLIALHGFNVQLTKKQRASLDKMEQSLLSGGVRPPDLSALASAQLLDEKATRQLLQVLVDQEKAINLEGKIYFHSDVVKTGRDMLRDKFKNAPTMTMSEFRILVDTSRKYALPLLNHYDNLGYTVRRDDIRIPGPKLNHE